MTNQIALDVHAHLVPVDHDRLAVLSGVEFDPDQEAMTIDGHRLAIKPLFHPEQLVAWMDANDVARAFVSAPPPLYREQLRAQPALKWANYINDGLVAICARHKDRLDPLFHLPTNDPSIARTVATAAIESGYTKFAMPTGTGDGRTLSDASFEPLWRTLDSARAFLFFHPGECSDGRLESYYLANLVGNPYETTVAISHLLFGRVLERFGKMVVCFAHGGGMIPAVAGRLQRGFDTQRPGIDSRSHRPQDAIGRIYVDCICHSEVATGAALDVFGRERVVFGSDWPFPMGIPKPDEQLAALSDDVRTQITQHNARQLLRRIG